MIERVAYLSVHTSPLESPGTGDAGGMNVYLDGLARTMARRGIGVDVFSRRTTADAPEVIEVESGYRVIAVAAGPPDPLPIASLPALIGEYAEAVIGFGGRYDLVHSHYWLSGWAGVLVKEARRIPLANSFHTLGRVKDLTRRADEPPSGPMRTLTEDEVIARSDCVVASTDLEAADLMTHYRAVPERLCVSPPGVDHDVFRPGDRRAAREHLGLDPGPVLLVAGRIQPLKGIDVAVNALDELHRLDARLLVVGGPSGPEGEAEMRRLAELAARRHLEERVHFVPPQRHDDMAHFYRAADVLLMPSRSESFGLVAAEAQASGLPVVAANVGGLPEVVAEGVSGHLVSGWEPADYAAAVRRILDDSDHAAVLAGGAVAHAARFSWPATADRLLELYEGITGG